MVGSFGRWLTFTIREECKEWERVHQVSVVHGHVGGPLQ